MPLIEYIKSVEHDIVVRVVTGEEDPYTSWDYAVETTRAYLSETEEGSQEPRWKQLTRHLGSLSASLPPNSYISASISKSQRAADLAALEEAAPDTAPIPPVSIFELYSTTA